MPDSYMIVFDGKIQDGHDPEEVKNRLAQLLRIEPAKTTSLFSGVHLILWRNLDLQAATALKIAVEKTGADCRIRRTRSNEEGGAAGRPAGVASGLAQSEAVANGSSEPGPPRLPTAQDNEPATPAVRPPTLSACPKCGYAARSITDDLLTSGLCPACGLVLAKYHSIEEVAPPPAVAPVPAPPEDTVEPDNSEDTTWDNEEPWDESENAADWQVFSRGTAILSLVVGFVFTVLPPGGYIESRPLRGLVAGIVVVFVSSLAYQSYLFYLARRGSFRAYALGSLGVLAVLAGLGGLLYRLYSGIGMFLSAPDWRSQVSFVRVGLLLSAVYLGAAIFLAYADQKALPSSVPETTVTAPGGRELSFDGTKYTQAVRDARARFGARFPKGERAAQYLYYKNVYLRASSSVGLQFPEMIRTMLPSFELADFHIVLDPELELLVFNAIGFRGELAAEGLIPDDLRRDLESLAWSWAEPTPTESRQLSYEDRVALFDSRCPVDDPTYVSR